MPIEYRTGNIFDSGADVLVCPVNCVGVMGAGLAKQFAKRMPWVERDYKQGCVDTPMKPGDGIWLEYEDHPGVLCLATKGHWRYPSYFEWIDRGLSTIRDLLTTEPITSIAIPPLGCGLGGLDWSEIKPLITAKLVNLNAHILIYEPSR